MTERPDLEAALQAAAARVAAMTPAERAAMLAAQRRSALLAEAAFGSDRDEAAYRDALARGDTETLARLKAEAETRVAAARRYLEEHP